MSNLATRYNIHAKMPDGIFDLKILHHGHASNIFVTSDYFKYKKIKISDDLVVLQVNDIVSSPLSKINKITFEDPSKSIEIIIPTYHKWTSKPKELVEFIENKYNSLPEYLLYVDGYDAVIINDILNPKEMLDYYQCEILFNCEPNYYHTGFVLPSDNFYDNLYTVEVEKYKSLNLSKYGISHSRSLNAGVFLGKKDSMLSILKETYEYMIDDPNKGFPYGSLDDQCSLRYMQNKYYDKIACDVYNQYFLFAYPKSIESEEDDWEHFQNFKRNYSHLYNKK
jgi:hypothetical protein